MAENPQAFPLIEITEQPIRYGIITAGPAIALAWLLFVETVRVLL